MTLPHGVEVFCECGDQLIHASRRGMHESSSLLGQYVHDNFDRVFSWIDVDALVWKRSKRRLLIAEHKYPGQQLSSAQREVLPLLGRIVALAIEHGLIAQGEVVSVYGAPPWQDCTVRTHPDDVTRDCSVADLLEETVRTIGQPWAPTHVFEVGHD